ncbi:hypothetical protein M422DRAFT_246579 [Sphaerobolus stellatus SS14]|nr:hypothetical protein M422DRAFT_246579 [Sphaerobolus stellatus SS14]
MSLARQRVLRLSARSIRVPLPTISRRLESSLSHSDHSDHSDHHHGQDSNVYPEETWNTPFWRGTVAAVLFTTGIYAAYPYLDKNGDYIQRFILRYRTPKEVWASLGSKHLEQSVKQASDALLVSEAVKSPVYRMRNPMSMDFASQHNVPVGASVDTSNVKLKKDDPWA